VTEYTDGSNEHSELRQGPPYRFAEKNRLLSYNPPLPRLTYFETARSHWR